ncbi:hypothetical protein [Bradyrhizobium sp. Cp5.3]|nr:hypothetical protein [Bradyrhizobium sp. Cp5.3]
MHRKSSHRRIDGAAAAAGPYRTEFYPAYDYNAAGMAQHDKATGK